MTKSKTKPYDASEYLETEADMAAYLQAALEDGDPALVIHALGNIARARGDNSTHDECEFDSLQPSP